MAFIDKLNRLEQLGALRSATEWMQLRQLRNLLSHEYDDGPVELTASINTVFDAYGTTQDILKRFADYLAPYLETE